MRKEISISEAIVEGAIDSHILTATHYPGGGASTVFEIFKKRIKCEESTNEKIAYEICLGVSYCGKRSICVVKNVGVNVLSDSLINSCFSGVNGGLVLVAVDDMYISYATNYEDSRDYYNLTKTLILEPSSPQEAYDMVKEAFVLSEKFELPIIIRLEKKSLSIRGPVETREERYKPKKIKKDVKRWVLFPPYTINQSRNLFRKQRKIREYVEKCKFNKFIKKSNDLLIVFGLAYSELRDLKRSILKIGTLPVPVNMIAKIIDSYRNIEIREIGKPVIEGEIFMKTNKLLIKGQLNGKIKPVFEKGCKNIKRRCEIPLLNKFFLSLNKTFPDVVFGDIGLHTLGAFPPCNTLDTSICMGACIGMGIGAKLAGLKKVFSVVGDSTFVHTGIPALIELKEKNIPLQLFILDNHCAISTGGQKTLGDIESIIKGVGVLYKKIDIKKLSDEELIKEINNLSYNKIPFVIIIDFSKNYL